MTFEQHFTRVRFDPPVDIPSGGSLVASYWGGRAEMLIVDAGDHVVHRYGRCDDGMYRPISTQPTTESNVDS